MRVSDLGHTYQVVFASYESIRKLEERMVSTKLPDGTDFEVDVDNMSKESRLGQSESGATYLRIGGADYRSLRNAGSATFFATGKMNGQHVGKSIVAGFVPKTVAPTPALETVVQA